jgi:hypothetical protein
MQAKYPAMKQHKIKAAKSTVTTKRKGVVSLPVGPAGWAGFVVTMPLSSQTSVFFPSRCEATKFPVFVDRIGEPVDSWVISNCTVCNINQNDLKIFEGGILIDPVGVKNPESTKLTSSTLLSN